MSKYSLLDFLSLNKCILCIELVEMKLTLSALTIVWQILVLISRQPLTDCRRKGYLFD